MYIVLLISAEITINSLFLHKSLTLNVGWKALHESQTSDPTTMAGTVTIQDANSVIKITTIKGKLSVKGGQLRADGVNVKTSIKID